MPGHYGKKKGMHAGYDIDGKPIKVGGLRDTKHPAPKSGPRVYTQSAGPAGYKPFGGGVIAQSSVPSTRRGSGSVPSTRRGSGSVPSTAKPVRSSVPSTERPKVGSVPSTAKPKPPKPPKKAKGAQMRQGTTVTKKIKKKGK